MCICKYEPILLLAWKMHWSRPLLVCSCVENLLQFFPQLTDRRTSLGDGNPRTVKDASLHQKTNTVANCPRHNDMLEAPEVPRRTSVDTGQPPRLPSRSPSRHLQPMALPVPPQSGCKTSGRRPVLGGECLMPSSLLNELNSVLSKTGRSTKNNDWQEQKKAGRKVHRAVCLNDEKKQKQKKKDVETGEEKTTQCRWSQSTLLSWGNHSPKTAF